MNALRTYLWWSKRAKKNLHCITYMMKNPKWFYYINQYNETTTTTTKICLGVCYPYCYKFWYNSRYEMYVLGISPTILLFFDFVLFFITLGFTFSIFSLDRNIICTYCLWIVVDMTYEAYELTSLFLIYTCDWKLKVNQNRKKNKKPKNK